MKPVTLLSLLFVFLASCKKEKLPNAGGTQLEKVVVRSTSNGSETGRATYTYNSQGQLTQVTNTTGSLVSHDSYEYDINGRMVKYTLDNSVVGVIFYYTFQFDGSNRIVRATGTPVLPGLALSDYTFAYDNKGRIIADSTFDGSLLMAYDVYAFDNNENVITEEKHVRTGIGMESQGVASLQYDDKINPYRMTGNPAYYSNPGSFEYLSRNNLIARSPDGGSVPFQYEYYSNGLIRIRKAAGASYESEFYYR